MAKNPVTEFRSWDDYMEEADVPPFLFPTPKGDPLVVEMPTGAAVMQIGRAYRNGDAEAVLELTTGDQWEAVKALLAEMPHTMMDNVTTDMLLHFDLIPERELVQLGENGKPKARKFEKDPRVVQRMVHGGWHVVGEGTASST